MGFFERIGRIIRANLHQLISSVEDPEKILEQTVLDLQDDLVKLRQAVAGAIASQKRTERQLSQSQIMAKEWYQRAQLALQKGDEILAKEALIRRKSYQETATVLQDQVTQYGAVVVKLKENMRSLESKIAETRAKKDMYIARVRSAEASQRLQEVVGSLRNGETSNIFDRVEEKVLQLEARSQALGELGENDLDQKFSEWEGNKIDEELAEMKAKLLSGNHPGISPGP